MKHILITLLALVTLSAYGENSFKVATSTYPGWMDNWLMEMKLNGKKSPSFLEAQTKASGTQVEIKKFPLYIPSVEALVSGDVDACTMAITEAITIVADKGIEAVIIFPHDYSNGNDQVQMPTAWRPQNIEGKIYRPDEFADCLIIAGKTFLLEELSVSHYLLYRYLQERNQKVKDYVKIANTPGDSVAAAYIAALENKPVGGVTWNPGCQRMMETGKSKIIFSSKDIPKEITDVLVVRKDRIAGKEKAIQAYVNAHFDVMDFLKNPKTRDKAIRAMASAAGFSPEETAAYSKMLEATRFYTNRSEAKTALTEPALQESIEKVKTFYATYAEPNTDAKMPEVDTQFLD